MGPSTDLLIVLLGPSEAARYPRSLLPLDNMVWRRQPSLSNLNPPLPSLTDGSMIPLPDKRTTRRKASQIYGASRFTIAELPEWLHI